MSEIEYIRMEPAGAIPTRRRLVFTNSDSKQTESPDFDIRDADPIGRALNSPNMPALDSNMQAFVIGALNEMVKEELIKYLEECIEPTPALKDLYAVIENISKDYRSEFGGDQ